MLVRKTGRMYKVVEHARNVLAVIELRQWLWFGVGAVLVMVSDYLYNLLICLAFGGKKIRLSFFCKGLVVYTEFILLVTLFCRESSLQAAAAPVLFWSWVEVCQRQNIGMLYDILLNILLFIPFGGLIKLTCKKIRLPVGWLIGFLLSMVIECSQLVFHLGLFEWDDMLHNSFGCLIGFVAAEAVKAVFCKLIKSRHC